MSRAPLQRPRRPLRRRIGRLCAVLLVASVFGAAAALPALAAPGLTGSRASTPQTRTHHLTEQYRPTVEDAETADTVAATLLVAPTEPVLSDGAESYRFTALLRNDGTRPLPAGTVRLTLDLNRVERLAQLDASADAEAQGSSVMQVSQQTVPLTQPGEEHTLTLSVPRSALPLDLSSSPGVYTVRAELRLPVTEPLETLADPLLVSESTPFVWQGVTEGASVPVTLVVPFVFPSSVRTMPSDTQLRDAVVRFSQLLDVAEQAQATLAVDPRIVAAISLRGEDAAPAAQDFLDRLSRTTLPVFMLQFADADPAAQAALGAESLLQPLGFSYLQRATGPETEQAENVTADDSQDSESGSDEPAVLTRLPQASAAAWPAPNSVNQETLKLLAASDLESLVLDSENVAQATGTRVRIGDFSALLADHHLTESTGLALSQGTTAERNAGLTDIVSRLAVAASQGSGGVVLAVDRAAISEAEDPAGLIASVLALNWVTPVPESLQPEGSGMLESGATGEQRRELLQEITERSPRIDQLAPLLTHPEYLLEYQRLRLLEAFATRYASGSVDFAQVEERIRTRDDELLTGVQIVPTENTQLVGTSSRVPVTLHNALPFQAHVTLRASPSSAGIVVPTRTFDDARVPAEGNHVVLIRVDSRISSGESGLHVEVTERAGETVFAERTLRLTLRSSYETILLVALGAIAALLLGFGIWRSIRRHEQPAEAPPEASGTHHP